MKKIYPFISTKVLTFIIFSLLFLCSSSIYAQTVVVDPGSPWAVPAGVTSIKVEVWGAGGAGGRGILGVGGGGGGGAYSTKTFIVAQNEQFTIIRGAGGANYSDNGGKSEVSATSGPVRTVTGNGGKGGQSVFIGLGAGGDGGTGDYNGGDGVSASNGGGGAGNGGSASGQTGGPGALQGGNGGDFGSGGAAPGGGAGAGWVIGGNTDGGVGRVVITYTAGPVAPTIDGFSPSTVCVGTSIQIKGNNFTNPSTVTFYNGIVAPSVSVTFVDAQTLNVVVPASASTGPITVGTSILPDAISASNLTVTNKITSLTVLGDGIFCGSTVVSASGGSGGTIYFQGTNPNGTDETKESPQTVNAIGTNTKYYFREKTACGWADNSYFVTVTINPNPKPFTVDVTPDCDNALLTPNGPEPSYYFFQGINSSGTSELSPGAQTVNQPGTYYYRAKTDKGCWSDPKEVVVKFKVTVVITDQPDNIVSCSGLNANLTVTATGGPGLQYQWRKGNTPLTNGGNISGATSSQLKFTPLLTGDAGTDYNCLITDDCGILVTDYVSVTINTAVGAPSGAPTSLTFNPVGTTSMVGHFPAVPDAMNYIVIRSLTPTPVPLFHQNGTYYTEGPNGSFNIDYIGPDVDFVSTDLIPDTKYYYWIYSFNDNPCGVTPLYFQTPLTGDRKTNDNSACSSVTNFYWYGDNSSYPKQGNTNGRNSNFNNASNWSTRNDKYNQTGGFIPGPCQIANFKFSEKYNGGTPTTITLSGNAHIYGLNFFNYGRKPASLLMKGNTLVVDDASVIVSTNNGVGGGSGIGDGGSGNSNGTIEFIGKVTLGVNTSPNTYVLLVGTSSSTIKFTSDLVLNQNVQIDGNEPGKVIFNGPAQKITWYNNVYDVNFGNVEVGDGINSTVLGFISSKHGALTGNLTIEKNSTLNLNVDNEWNRLNTGGTLTMKDGSSLNLQDNKSTLGQTVSGSNFPGGFSTYTLDPTSTVTYNGTSNITQTIYDKPVYGNLNVSRRSGGGISPKIVSNPVTIKGTANLLANTITTLGANILTQSGASVNVTTSTTTLDASTFNIGGAGTFNLLTGGTLKMASSAGITSSGPTGNIQTNTRNFDPGANYIYNGTVAQNTGNGLPSSVYNLTIDNPLGVSLNNSPERTYSASNTLYLTNGDLLINGNILTINKIALNSGRLYGSPTSNVTINGSNIPLKFSNTPKAAVIKDLVINSNKSAFIDIPATDTLNITGGAALNSEGSITLGTSATLTTNDNLILNSNEFGTSRVAIIQPGTAKIIGKVSVERYLPVLRKAWHLLAPNTQGSTIRDAWQEGAQRTGAAIVNPKPGYGININGEMSDWKLKGFDYDKSNLPVMKYWTPGGNDYKGVLNTTDANSFNDRSGYFVFVRGDRSVLLTSPATKPTTLRSKGNLFQPNLAGSIPPASPSTNLNAGEWAIVGNPYASPINFYALGTAGLSQNYYIWDPNGNNTSVNSFNTGIFRTISQDPNTLKLIEVPDGNSAYPGDIPYIQSGQAFFVQAITSGKVSFTENAKVTGSSPAPFFNKTNTNTYASLRATLYSNKSGKELADGVLSLFGDEYSNELDEWDAEKFPNTSENMGIFSNNKILAIERRSMPNVNDTIFYNTDDWKIQNYVFAFVSQNMERSGLKPYLNDRYLNIQKEISVNDTTFVEFNIANIPGSWALNRFYVTFKATGSLPVTLLTLTAELKSENVEVEWITQNEVNVKEYEVEKSLDGQNFTKAATILSTQRGSDSYKWLDEKAGKGWNYYRIRSTDKDGNSTLSKVVKVNISAANGLITVAPNPVVNGRINLQFKEEISGIYKVRLLNSLGQVVVNKKINHNGGTNLYVINTDFNTPHEIYQLEITKPGGDIELIKVVF